MVDIATSCILYPVAAPSYPSEALPTPARERTVTGATDAARSASFKGMLTSAVAGDQINLPDGNYTGAYTVPLVAGVSVSAQIVIKSINKGGAKFTARTTIDGKWVKLWGIDFAGGVVTANTASEDCAAIRCRFKDRFGLDATTKEGLIANIVNGKRMMFLFCTFHDYWERGVRCTSTARNPEFHRCHFFNWTYNGTSQVHECIQLGTDNSTTDSEIAGVVSQCFFKDCNQNNTENEIISIKSCGNTIKDTVLDNARTITVRHGLGNTVQCCIVQNGTNPAIRVYDGAPGRGNLIIGNLLPSGKIHTCKGNNVHPLKGANGVYRPTTRECKLYGNTATINNSEIDTINADNSTLNSSGTQIYANSVAPTLNAGTYDVASLVNQWNSPSPVTVPPRITLTETMVGWNGTA